MKLKVNIEYQLPKLAKSRNTKIIHNNTRKAKFIIIHEKPN